MSSTLVPPVFPGLAGPGVGGLLQPQQVVPPPLPPVPHLVPPGLRPTGLSIGAEQMLAYLEVGKPDGPPDVDSGLPPQLQRYAAGLRPTPKPPSAEWQQEIVYERLARTDQEIETVARYYLSAAQQYDNYLSSERIEASQYYNGMPLGDEEKGRSKLVLTVVRDTIRATLPSLLRIFCAVEDPVSFEPISNEITGNDQLSTALARQATDYCRWALFTCNKGWQILHDCLLDALTRKAGWARWHWGRRNAVQTEVCEGLLLPQLQMLLAEPGIETQRIVRRPATPTELQAIQQTPEGQMYLQSGAPPEVWSATITRTAQQAWPRIEAVPPESVWIVSDAATVENARGIFHVRDVAASDLIEQGLPADLVLASTSSVLGVRKRQELIARNNAVGYNLAGSPPNDRSMAYVRYAEGWIRTDVDGDNRAELIHVHLLGDNARLVEWERVDEIPLACFTPYREPTRVVGSSQADMVMDLQRVETRVMRATLDSLGQAMFPRTCVTLGQVNMADVRQTAIGSIIRVAQQGAVTELVKPFAGKEALPVLEVLESIREGRTGITRASSGLTVDELQSTTPIAVSQQTSAAQDRLDMVARTLAETGLAPLYSGLLRMLARQQDRPNVIRIRGAWHTIDPRALAVQWECQVNVGGRGTQLERLAMLGQIAGKQEQIIQMGGFTNPLVGIPEYRNTLARMLETANISDVSSYFKQLPPGFAPPPQPQPPNTDLILAQVQSDKTAADIESNRAEAQTNRAKAIQDDDLERDKAALEAWARVFIASKQFGGPVPGLDEFKTAMKSNIPPVGLISDQAPSPSSPQQPATSPQGQQQAQQRPGLPPLGMPVGQPGRPMVPSAPTPPAPAPAPSPATQMAARQALTGGGPPSAYGQIANRAMASALFGPGGPRIPAPGGQPNAG